MQDDRPRIYWQSIIELSIVLFTILGTTIPLYIHTDSKIHESNSRVEMLIISIHSEMKDFHGRLCAIEERNKGK